MTSLVRLLVLLMASAALSACGGGGGGSTPTPEQPVVVTVTAVSPVSVRSGDALLLTGSGFAGISRVRIGGVVATILSRTATSMSVRVPLGITQGAIELVLTDGSTQAVTQALTILPNPVIGGFSPGSGTVGTLVTVTGSALDAVDRVLIGQLQATIQSQSAGSLSFTVPAGAVDGVITLFAGTTQVSSSTVFDVVTPIVATGFSPASGPAGTAVTVTGSGLDGVSTVTLGGTAMTVLSKSAGQLMFVAQASGSIVLTGPGGQSVPVGSFTVNAAAIPAVSLTRIDVAQTYAQQTGTAYQRLSPGKPALVRAYVHGAAAIASPAVSLVAQRNGNTLGTLGMSGPGTLPLAAPRATALAETFNATLPAEWVDSGLTLTVTVANSNPANSGATLSVSPQLGGKKVVIDLVVVPVTVASNSFGGKATATTPDATEIKTRLQRAFPFDASRISVSVRASLDLSGTISRADLFSSNSTTRSNEWSAALQAVETLRDGEAPGRHYYGLLPGTGFSGSGTVGLGYLNGSAFSYQPSAIGLDSAVDFWLDTLVHELGHNFSLEHAPCGGVSDPDSSFPYDGGRLGTTPIYDNVALTLTDPRGPDGVANSSDDLTDVMGYCDGQWFSDYNYDKAQRFQETLPSAQAAVYSQPQELLAFRGAVAADGSVTLMPASAQTGTQRPVQREGDYRLLITLEDGRVLSEPIAPTPVADGPDRLLHFKATLVNPGRVVAVAVARSGAQREARVRMPAGIAAAEVGTRAADRSTAPDRTPRVQLSEQGGQATLRWDATVWPVLAVRHVGPAGTTVLAPQLSGGAATLSTAGLPAGGRFEFSLSDGLNARALSVAR